MDKVDFVNEFYSLKLKSVQNPQLNRDRAIGAEDIDALHQWAEQNGITLNGVCVSRSNGMNCITTTRNLTAEEVTIQVPRQAMITEESVLQSTVGQWLLSIKDSQLNQIPQIKIILFLLNELQSLNSSQSQYLNVLPRAFSIPFDMERQFVADLKRTLIYAEIEQAMKSIVMSYRLLIANIEKYPGFPINSVSFSDFIWAYCILFTRQNYIPTQDHINTDILALVPIWDMTNHDNCQVSTSYDFDNNQLITKSSRDYTHGEEYFMSYGQRTNWDLFLYSGFIINDNQYDMVKLKCKLTSDSLLNVKIQLLKQLQISQNGLIALYVPLSDLKNGKLFQFIHIEQSKSMKDLENVSQSSSLTESKKNWIMQKLKTYLGQFSMSQSRNPESSRFSVDENVQRYIAYEIQLVKKIMIELIKM